MLTPTLYPHLPTQQTPICDFAELIHTHITTVLKGVLESGTLLPLYLLLSSYPYPSLTLLLPRSPQESVLSDGAGQRPCYNLRTLCRALDYARTSAPIYSLQRALYDGFAMGFLTLLDPARLVDVWISVECVKRLRVSRISLFSLVILLNLTCHYASQIPTPSHLSPHSSHSAPRMEAMMLKHLLPGTKTVKALLSRAPATPPGAAPDAINPTHVLFEHFWLEAGSEPLPSGGKEVDAGGRRFVATPSVHQHLVNLARAVLIRCGKVWVCVGLVRGEH